MAKMTELSYETVRRESYYSNMVPCGCYLFVNLKKRLTGKRFCSNYEIMTETDAIYCKKRGYRIDEKPPQSLRQAKK